MKSEFKLLVKNSLGHLKEKQPGPTLVHSVELVAMLETLLEQDAQLEELKRRVSEVERQLPPELR